MWRCQQSWMLWGCLSSDLQSILVLGLMGVFKLKRGQNALICLKRFVTALSTVHLSLKPPEMVATSLQGSDWALRGLPEPGALSGAALDLCLAMGCV